jgi:hypothetical protein
MNDEKKHHKMPSKNGGNFDMIKALFELLFQVDSSEKQLKNQQS